MVVVELGDMAVAVVAAILEELVLNIPDQGILDHMELLVVVEGLIIPERTRHTQHQPQRHM